MSGSASRPFHLDGEQGSVAIDPFGDMSALSSSRGIKWDYPAIAGLGQAPAVRRLERNVFETGELPSTDGPLVVVPAAP